jgi:hypothetical protein
MEQTSGPVRESGAIWDWHRSAVVAVQLWGSGAVGQWGIGAVGQWSSGAVGQL